jgi:hypothetical protein
MPHVPLSAHPFLRQLLGEWTFETVAVMAAEQPAEQFRGRETVRQVGPWLLLEGQGAIPNGGQATNVMTLGFDPDRQRFVGTFLTSMMTYLWIYDGQLDAAEKVLTLDTEGPSFAGDGSLARYQDWIEFHSPDHRTLSSRVLQADGTWHHFMQAHYHRVAA